MFFDDLRGLIRVVIASIAGYAALVAFLRISGKRTLTKLNAFDLVVTVALGSTLATIILSEDVAILEGLLGLLMLVLLQFVVTYLTVHVPGFLEVVKSEPRLLVRHGVVVEEALRKERINPKEILAAVRSEGLTGIEEAGAVILETDGSLSVIPEREVEGKVDLLRPEGPPESDRNPGTG